MASPVPNLPMGGWNPNGPTMPPQNDFDESGLQVRPMSLKVHYTFDKDGKVNCLARYPHTLQVQTIPLDEKTTIGLIDLRICLRAVTDCSPELAGQDGDYTVYALDYSEEDTPLVGQGMLSWALESMRNEWGGQPPKMVTGRVTKNLLGVFGGGNRETLEVRLKLTAGAKVQRPDVPTGMEMQPMRSLDTVMTPTGVAEWNSFIQANPMLGHSAQVSRVASPAMSQAPPQMLNRRDSFGPNAQGMPGQEIQRIAPIPVDPATIPNQPATSRPSSRASRRKAPTGRPRGRPRKKPVEGNTSGYEDGTEGEEGPAKKKAKTTKVEKAAPNPFGPGHESLRVAASTSGSLRNFRPIAPNHDAMAGNHLQEVPRAPTPVPEGPMSIPPRGQNASKLRRESSMSQEFNPNNTNQLPLQPRPLSPSQEDGRSPDSAAPTPNYSEDSPRDIGSSPPILRAAPTPYMRSSPPVSSPVLPPMPLAQLPQDSSFSDIFGDGPLQQLQEEQYTAQLPPRKVLEATDATGVPTQVFQIDGQDLVHIQNYNTPLPTSTPAGPPPSLPPMKKQALHQPRPTRVPIESQVRRLPTPPLAPTPPPTTDEVEKIASPAPVAVLKKEVVEPVKAPKKKKKTPPKPTPSQEAAPAQNSGVSAPRSVPKPLKAKASIPRPLNRSHSAGPLAFPTVPASEPIGPSSLSQSTVAEPPRVSIETSAPPPRPKSTGPQAMPVPASDPLAAVVASLELPIPAFTEPPAMPVPASDPLAAVVASLELPIPAFTEPPYPQRDAPDPMPSSPPAMPNKNQVKKQSIKQRLEQAVNNGEMPPFCVNCGAIETATWRKIWVQDHEGDAGPIEFSDKPGRVIAVDILTRDEDKKPTSHRLVKKSLGYEDDKLAWQEQLLCNPCGIWLTKYQKHRPEDKWNNYMGSLGRDRSKRGSGGTNRKRSRTKSYSQANPTSEAFAATDPLGPTPSSPIFTEANPSQEGSRPSSGQSQDSQDPSVPMGNGEVNDSMELLNPGSTHSRGSGTAGSPITLEDDEQLGTTKRLLFPSPRKDASLKVLGELNVNIVQTVECRQNKELVAEKENIAIDYEEAEADHDELEALFRSPAGARPSTPPPKARAAINSGPFKTPTRPTPSHRPITRSVSRSLRSVRGMTSPRQQALLQRTPTKTPRSALTALIGSASRRRSPRNHQVNFDSVFDTPLARAINQMLSDSNFGMANNELDLSNLPGLDTNEGGLIDFGNLLSTDGAMSTSSPKHGMLEFNYSGTSDIFAGWAMDSRIGMDGIELDGIEMDDGTSMEESHE
ncbi:hypothetical protein G7046_g6929 [Stylonectria norvegica]|nr:hypothetical protein G7046_g6929 [Stylonectria norvegica]